MKRVFFTLVLILVVLINSSTTANAAEGREEAVYLRQDNWNFEDYTVYSEDGYFGVLFKSGDYSTYLKSGSLTKEHSKTVTITRNHPLLSGLPSTYYYASGGYTGYLDEVGDVYTIGSLYYQDYAGIVTKPELDTREFWYKQKYEGFVFLVEPNDYAYKVKDKWLLEQIYNNKASIDQSDFDPICELMTKVDVDLILTITKDGMDDKDYLFLFDYLDERLTENEFAYMKSVFDKYETELVPYVKWNRNPGN